MRMMMLAQRSLVALACVGLLVPRVGLADQTTTLPQTPAPVSDLALQAGGTLTGQVLDRQGAPVAEGAVVVTRDGQVVAATQTGAEGQFLVTGLRGGLYQVHTEAGSASYRLWTEQTAPPSAQPEALVVAQNEIVRGQLPGLGILGNPFVLGIIIAAAVAIPIALDESS